MYNVLIVDDEVLVRVGLKTTIDWESMGFNVIAEASNGEQGYEQYLKHKPDVVFTDIRMPKKDGLWLVEEIRKENPNVYILVLTCHNEFSFVRNALKAGANDYILKSEVEDEELMELMEKVKSILDVESLKKKEENHKIINKNSLQRTALRDLIKTRFKFTQAITEQCKSIDFSIEQTNYVFLSINIIRNKEKSDDLNNQKIKNAIMNILFDQFGERDISYIYHNIKNDYHFLLSSNRLCQSDIEKIGFTVISGAKQYFDRIVDILYSDVILSTNSLEREYNEFMKKCLSLFYVNKESFILSNISDICFNEINVFELKKKYNTDIIDAIGKGDHLLTKSICKEIFNYFTSQNINPESVKIFYLNLVGDVFNSYGEHFNYQEDFNNHEYYYNKIMISETLDNVDELINNFVEIVIEQIKNISYGHTNIVIKRVLNYINQHYMEQISLNDVAVEFNLSKHYMSYIFKKETGETMSYYINKVKIEMAKEMLVQPDIRSKEIYEKVGYSNQQYFSKMFKRMTGMTVMEYKENRKASS